MFIKHDMFMDVCIEVRSVANTKDGLKLYGSFWGIGQDNKSFPIGGDIRLRIDEDNYLSWKICVDSGEDLRIGPWIDIGTWAAG